MRNCANNEPRQQTKTKMKNFKKTKQKQVIDVIKGLQVFHVTIAGEKTFMVTYGIVQKDLLTKIIKDLICVVRAGIYYPEGNKIK